MLPSLSLPKSSKFYNSDHDKAQIEQANVKGNILHLYPLTSAAKCAGSFSVPYHPFTHTYPSELEYDKCPNDDNVNTAATTSIYNREEPFCKSECPFASSNYAKANSLVRHSCLESTEVLKHWTIMYMDDRECERARHTLKIDNALLDLFFICKQIVHSNACAKPNTPISSTQNYTSRLYYQAVLQYLCDDAIKIHFTVNYITYWDEQFNTYVLFCPKSAIYALSGKFIVYVKSTCCLDDDINNKNNKISIEDQRAILSKTTEQRRNEAMEDVIHLSELLRQKHNLSAEENNLSKMLEDIVTKQQKERMVAEERVSKERSDNKNLNELLAHNRDRKTSANSNDGMNGIYVPHHYSSFRRASEAENKVDDTLLENTKNNFDAKESHQVFVTPLDLKRFARKQERELQTKIDELCTEEQVDRDVFLSEEHISFVTLLHCANQEEELLHDVFDEERLQRIYLTSEERVEFITLTIDAKHEKEQWGEQAELSSPQSKELLLLLKALERPELAVIGQLPENSLHESQISLSTMSVSLVGQEDNNKYDDHHYDANVEQINKELDYEPEYNDNNTVNNNNNNNNNNTEDGDVDGDTIDEGEKLTCESNAKQENSVSDVTETDENGESEHVACNQANNEMELIEATFSDKVVPTLEKEVSNLKSNNAFANSSITSDRNLSTNDGYDNVDNDEINSKFTDALLSHSHYSQYEEQEEQQQQQNEVGEWSEHNSLTQKSQYYEEEQQQEQQQQEEEEEKLSEEREEQEVTMPVSEKIECNNDVMGEDEDMDVANNKTDKDQNENDNNTCFVDPKDECAGSNTVTATCEEVLENKPLIKESHHDFFTERDSSVEPLLLHEFAASDHLTPEQIRTLHTITTVTITLQVAEAKKLYKQKAVLFNHSTSKKNSNDEDEYDEEQREEDAVQQLHNAVCRAVLEDVRECLADRVARVKIEGKRKKKKKEKKKQRKTRASARKRQLANEEEQQQEQQEESEGEEGESHVHKYSDKESKTSCLQTEQYYSNDNNDTVGKESKNNNNSNNVDDTTTHTTETEVDANTSTDTEDMKEVINLLVQHDGVMSDDEMRALIASYSFPRLLKLYQSIEEDIKLANSEDQVTVDKNAETATKTKDTIDKPHNDDNNNVNLETFDDVVKLTDKSINEEENNKESNTNVNKPICHNNIEANANENIDDININNNCIDDVFATTTTIPIPLYEWQMLEKEFAQGKEQDNTTDDNNIGIDNKNITAHDPSNNVCKCFIDFISANRHAAAQEFCKLHYLEVATSSNNTDKNNNEIHTKCIPVVQNCHVCVFLHGDEWNIVINHAAYFLREQFIRELAEILHIHPSCIRNVVLQTGYYNNDIENKLQREAGNQWRVCVMNDITTVAQDAITSSVMKKEVDKNNLMEAKMTMLNNETEGKERRYYQVHKGLFIHCDVLVICDNDNNLEIEKGSDHDTTVCTYKDTEVVRQHPPMNATITDIKEHGNNKRNAQDEQLLISQIHEDMMQTVQTHCFALLYELYSIRHELEEVNVDAEVDNELEVYTFDVSLSPHSLSQEQNAEKLNYSTLPQENKYEISSNDDVNNNSKPEKETSNAITSTTTAFIDQINDLCTSEQANYLLPPRPPSGRANFSYPRLTNMFTVTDNFNNNNIGTSNSNSNNNNSNVDNSSREVNVTNNDNTNSTQIENDNFGMEQYKSPLSMSNANSNCTSSKRQSLLERLTQRVNSRRSSSVSSTADVRELSYVESITNISA